MGRKIAKVRMSLELLDKILQGKIQGVESTTAPQDLKVVALEQPEVGRFNQWCYVYFESDSNKELQEGEETPEVKPFQYNVSNWVILDLSDQAKIQKQGREEHVKIVEKCKMSLSKMVSSFLTNYLR